MKDKLPFFHQAPWQLDTDKLVVDNTEHLPLYLAAQRVRPSHNEKTAQDSLGPAPATQELGTLGND